LGKNAQGKQPMAFNLFGKKDSQPKKSVVDLVATMRSAGQSNDQILQGLQRDGYTTAQIFDAIQLADAQSAAKQPIQADHMAGNPQNPMNLQPQSILNADYAQQQFPPQMQSYNQQPPMPPMQSMNQMNSMPNMPPMPPQAQQQAGDMDTQQIEALIEAVIEEKWQDIERNINKVIEWKESTEQLLQNMQQQIADVKGQVDSLQKAIIGKIGDYDKNVLEVGAQLNAMERAFSQVLPTFTENINELNRITQRLKK